MTPGPELSRMWLAPFHAVTGPHGANLIDVDARPTPGLPRGTGAQGSHCHDKVLPM